MSESHEFGVVLAFDESRNRVHRSGAVQRHRRDYIFYAGRAEFFHELLEARGFYLEYSLRVSRGEKVENLRIVVSRFIEVYLDAVIFPDVVDSHFNIGQVSKSQEVHFKESQVFEFHARVLTCNIFAVSSEGHVPVEYIRADYNSARVRACLPRTVFEFRRNVHDPLYFGRVVVHIDEFGNGEVHAVVFRALFRVVFPEHL